MKTSRRKIEEVLWAAGLHSVARSVYALTMGREARNRQASMTSFYRALLPPQALVFDIGANVGIFAKVFASLGARVIALEPNSDCVRHIQLSYPDARIETIQAVAGPRNGLAVLKQSDKRDDLSSVSGDWISKTQGDHEQGLWSREITVPMVSLDSLVEHFGMPYFIKVDVEGFEEAVLDGLSRQPELLSFEFNGSFFETTARCLDCRIFAEGSLFNFAVEDPVRFELTEWVKKDELKKELKARGKSARYGDVFIKPPRSTR